ncbi:hypothetical protein J6590_072708 [Homalodisca vitripennis]|nr:hypothetical protein J6590_072708 [Homalodisca vitripennis]
MEIETGAGSQTLDTLYLCQGVSLTTLADDLNGAADLTLDHQPILTQGTQFRMRGARQTIKWSRHRK